MVFTSAEEYRSNCVCSRMDRNQFEAGPYRRLVFMQHLIVFGHRDAEYDRSHVLEAMDPLLTLASLAAHVEQSAAQCTTEESMIIELFTRSCHSLRAKPSQRRVRLVMKLSSSHRTRIFQTLPVRCDRSISKRNFSTFYTAIGGAHGSRKQPESRNRIEVNFIFH